MRILRIIGLALGTLVAAILVIAIALFVNGWNTLNSRQAHAVPELRVAPHDSLISRGRHLASIQCVSCHGSRASLPLSGGDENVLAGTPLGVLHAPNLTAGGVLSHYSDGELARAIREGVNQKGKAMIVMPSADSRSLSDSDLAALISYLRSQPSVSKTVPEKRFSPVAYLVLGLRLAETSVQHPVTEPITHPHEGPDREYGDYLVRYLGCRSCHGIALDGKGRMPFTPEGPDLIPLVAAHDLGRFTSAMREGRAMGDGHEMTPSMMPWPVYASLTDAEVAAIHAHIRSVGAR